jgi:cation transport ATPase
MGVTASLATALAVGRAGRAGVVVRSGETMERLGRMETVFLDKTGTVTTGEPVISRIEILDPEVSEGELLGWLAGAEAGSEHSLGRAIMHEAERRSILGGTTHAMEVLPGLGVRAEVTRGGVRREVTAGRPSAGEANGGTATIIEVAWSGKRRGRVMLVDRVRAGAARAVEQLHQEGVATVLLSGDRLEATQEAADKVGIARVEAAKTPEQKIELIRAHRGIAGMVGDGINDAPALAVADVGIAVGSGTDIARQTAEVVLISNRLEQVPWLIALSRRTRTIIKQNLVWAFGYNMVALGAAALGWLHPLLAATAMTVSSLTVLGNSLRLQRFPDMDATGDERNEATVEKWSATDMQLAQESPSGES